MMREYVTYLRKIIVNLALHILDIQKNAKNVNSLIFLRLQIVLKALFYHLNCKTLFISF